MASMGHQTQDVDNREIRDMLRRAGAVSGASLSRSRRHPTDWESTPSFWTLLSVDIRREMRSLPGGTRRAFLVYAVLAIRLCFQFVLNPPLGVWQDNGQCIITEVGRAIPVCEHKAGTAIALGDPHFWLFLFATFLLFASSSSIIVLVVLNGRIKLLCLGLNLMLCFMYFYSVLALTDSILLASCLGCLSAAFPVLALLLSGIDDQ